MTSDVGNAYYVVGTDTACGKTVVTAALAAYLRKKGKDVGVMKPFESGGNDSVYLKEISGSLDPIEEINPYHFDQMLAPGVAAEMSGVKVSFDRVAEIFSRLKGRHDILLVEGAGGLMTPLDGNKTHIDLIKRLDVKALLVARLGLGTLNHTLLTLEVMDRYGVDCMGVVLSEIAPDTSDAAISNGYVLTRYFNVPLIGTIKFIDNINDLNELAKSVPSSIKIFK